MKIINKFIHHEFSLFYYWMLMRMCCWRSWLTHLIPNWTSCLNITEIKNMINVMLYVLLAWSSLHQWLQLHKHWIHMLTPYSGRSDKVRMAHWMIFSPISQTRLFKNSGRSTAATVGATTPPPPHPHSQHPPEVHSELPRYIKQTNQSCYVCVETWGSEQHYLFSPGFTLA